MLATDHGHMTLIVQDDAAVLPLASVVIVAVGATFRNLLRRGCLQLDLWRGWTVCMATGETGGISTPTPACPLPHTKKGAHTHTHTMDTLSEWRQRTSISITTVRPLPSAAGSFAFC